MTNIPIVCYLFTVFDEISSMSDFINHYNKFNSGMKHKLIVCFKLLEISKVKILRNKLNNINYEEFIDPEIKNDFDFGSYKRIAEKYPNNQILFLNSHSYPVSDNWLLKLMNYSNDNTFIGTSASNESILNSLKLKKRYKLLSYIFRKIYYKRKFKNFPNPHIRTSSFLLNSKNFLEYISSKKITSKEDTWEIESGKESLFNYFKDKNFNIYVINSDGNKFVRKDWKLSETYNYFKQSKLIISDKHTRKYEILNDKEKFISRLKVWGE
tara:strand:- start:863 stop:1666 length:804 start_codon:yes stop_codon:yes gene_type:complete